MSNLIIHIGLHKTGTTFLQHNFFPKIENTFYAHNNEFFVPWKKQLLDKPDNMLLSYEGFSGFPWDEKVLNNKKANYSWFESFQLNVDQLKKLFPKAIILIFFRKHGDLLISIYKQYLQEGGTKRLVDFYGEKKIIENRDLNFTNRINYLNKRFDNVFCLNYETFRKQGNNYILSFLERELSLQVDYKNFNSNSSNISISGKKLELLRRLNIVYLKLPSFLKKILKIFKLTPRMIVQKKLYFWKSKDNKGIIKTKDDINLEFKNDWDFFLKNQWKG